MSLFSGLATLSKLLVAVVVLALFSVAGQAAETIVTKGTIESVEVFDGQARVTRSVAVESEESAVQIIVKELPATLIPGSLHAEGGEGVTVRKIHVVQTEPADAHAEEVDRLQEEFAEVTEQLAEARHELKVAAENLAVIESMVRFSSEKSEHDLHRGRLDVEAVVGLADFAIQRRGELADRKFQNEVQIAELEERLNDNKLELEELAAEKVPISYEARVVVDLEAEKSGNLYVRYDVAGCTWAASYALRGDPDRAEYQLQGNAEISNQSGEDWSDVSLTLSTTAAAHRADPPRLSPLPVIASADDGLPDVDAASLNRRWSSGRDPFAPNGVPESSPLSYLPGVGGRLQTDTLLNQTAGLQQLRELRQPHQIDRRLANDAAFELLGSSFELTEVELRSQPETQTFVIFRRSLSGDLEHILIPLLSSYAYRRVTLENTLSHGIIPGPVDVVWNGKFVGRTDLPGAAIGQPLQIGLGPDYQIRTRRELMSRMETPRGGNRLVQYKYRLVAANLHDEPVACQLFDRIPVAEQTNAVTIQLAEQTRSQLSTDPLYERMRQPLGILRWDQTLPPNTSGSDSTDIEYEYQIEITQSQKLTSPDLVNRILQDQRFQYRNIGGGMGGGMMGGGGDIGP